MSSTTIHRHSRVEHDDPLQPVTHVHKPGLPQVPPFAQLGEHTAERSSHSLQQSIHGRLTCGTNSTGPLSSAVADIGIDTCATVRASR